MSTVLGLPVTDPKVKQVAAASWSNYGRAVADFLNFTNIDIFKIYDEVIDESDDPDGFYGILSKVIQEKRGALIVTAHFGNWEVAGAGVSNKMQLAAVVDAFKDPRMNDLIQSQRTTHNMTIIPTGGATEKAIEHLQQNHAVAIVIDRPKNPKTGVPVQFFGKTAYVPKGPALIAIRSGAPVLPGFAWYNGDGRYCGKLFSPINKPDTMDEEEAIRYLSQKMYDAIEDMIRKHPDQWYMFRKFWVAPKDLPVKETENELSGTRV